MSQEEKGHYTKKHASDRKVNQDLASALKQRAVEGTMPCSVAFNVASDLRAAPDEVGFTLDSMEVKLVKCQLGLFGYAPEKKVVKPAGKVPEDLEEAIQKEMHHERLPCAAAWSIAKNLGIRKMEVSSACETLGVKIAPCQLGAF